MAQNEIVRKLNTFLENHNPLTKECHVVYLMAQTRKLLDHSSDSIDYNRLRFYCDWVVHITKEYKMEDISPLIEEVYNDVVKTIKTHPLVAGGDNVIDFLYLNDLKNQLITFLNKNGVVIKYLENDGWWDSFVPIMVNVLSDQPIINPIENVKELKFTNATNSTVYMRIDFNNPISNKHGEEQYFFELRNAF